MLAKQSHALRFLIPMLALVVAMWPKSSFALSPSAQTMAGDLHDNAGAVIRDQPQRPQTTCDVGLVTDVGGINDGSFNQSAYEGLVRARLDFGIQLRWIETSRPQDYVSNLRQLADQGCGLIISIGFLMTQSTEQVARERPGIKFAIVDVDPESVPNLRGLVFDFYEMGYLAGALAGLMTESDVVGIVAGMEIPPVVNLRTGYEDSALEFNPTVTRLGIYLPSFTDPIAGAQAATAFMALGADVIFGAGGPTGSGAVLQAAQNDTWAIGVDSDEYFTTFRGGSVAGSRFLLSSAVKFIDNAVYDTVEDYIEGNFTAGAKLYDLSNQGVGLAPFHEADPYVPQQVKDALAAIVYGSQVVSSTVTPQGGSLVSLDEDVSVEFPAGAFTNQVQVYFRPQVGQPTDGLVGIDQFFELGILSSVSEDRVDTILQTSTIRIHYRNHETLNVAERTLGLYRWNGTRWLREQSTVVDIASNTITTTPNHLGRFAVLGVPTRPLYLPLLKASAS